MNIKIILIPFLSCASTLCMNNLRQDLSQFKHHFKRGFKTGLSASLYSHNYNLLTHKFKQFKSNDILPTIVILGPYVYDHLRYYANPNNQNDPDTPRTVLSYMCGYAFGFSIGFVGIDFILKCTNPSYPYK